MIETDSPAGASDARTHTASPSYPWEGSSGRFAPTLPRHVKAVLVLAHTAELTATGPERRRAFQTMRILLGGALDAGYSLAAISECLGVSPSSLRGLAETGRELSLDAMQALGLDPGALQEMGHPRIFGSPRKHHDGQRYCSAAAILRGLGILP